MSIILTQHSMWSNIQSCLGVQSCLRPNLALKWLGVNLCYILQLTFEYMMWKITDFVFEKIQNNIKFRSVSLSKFFITWAKTFSFQIFYLLSSQNSGEQTLILILISNIIFLLSEHPLKRRATRRARSGSVRRTGSRNRRQGSVRSGSQASNIDRVSSIRRPNGLGRSRRKLENFENENNTTKSETQKQDLESGDGFLTKPPEKSVKDQIYNILHSGKSILKFI